MSRRFRPSREAIRFGLHWLAITAELSFPTRRAIVPETPLDGAFGELGDQQACRIDRTRHGDAARRNALEAALAVIGLVADQDHQPMALGARLLERARDQGLADAAIAKRRLDRQRPEQQRLGLADPHRRQPHRSDQQRADPRGERQIEAVRHLLAQAVGGLGVAPGAEGALVQPLDAGASAGVSGRIVRETSFMRRRLASAPVRVQRHAGASEASFAAARALSPRAEVTTWRSRNSIPDSWRY